MARKTVGANATIPAVDDDFAKDLSRVYHKIREFEGRKLIERTTDGKTELIETNGIRVLFYPPEFQFPEYVLGLRYNENWVAECVKFGHRRKDLLLCPLISDPDAVALSWRDADLVPGLKADLPKVPLKPVPVTEEAVEIHGPVKAYVIGTHTLKEIFQCKEKDVLTVYEVESKGITELVHQDGKWNPHESLQASRIAQSVQPVSNGAPSSRVIGVSQPICYHLRTGAISIAGLQHARA